MVPDGHRHNHLRSLAGKLRHHGAAKETIVAALLAENAARCVPPKPDDEVIRLAEDIADRYDPDVLATVHVKLPPPATGNGQEASANGQAAQSSAPEQPQEKEVELLPVVPISKLDRIPPERKWLLEGYLARGRITMLSALFKAGKTTWLAYLLLAMETEGRFIGQWVRPCKVLVITEEHPDEWAERRDLLGLKDHIDVLVRPAMYKMSAGEWLVFLNKLKATQQRNQYDLIVIDPISNLWPVKDENNAAEVQAALMPLHQVLGDAAMLLLHHLRKAEGQEGTQSRGSGAIAAFIDLLVELRRFSPKDLSDRRRVLTATGRFRETPVELVVTLGEDGYATHGSRSDVRQNDLAAVIRPALPEAAPGATAEELLERLPESCDLGKSKLYAALNKGYEATNRRWERSGGGVRGDPFRFYRSGP
jgi:hypothetical protein